MDRFPRFRGGFLAAAAATSLLAAPSGLAFSHVTARAQTTDGAIVGIWPGWNLDQTDRSVGPDIGTYDSCTQTSGPGNTPSNGLPSYLADMNKWQGKHNTVIDFYYGLDSANYFGYNSPCNNSQFVPFIWDYFDAVPMQTAQLAPPAGWAIGDTTSADDSIFASFGQNLNRWLNSADALGKPAPTGGRRYYIRFNWEGNGTWVPWGPDYAKLDATGGTYVPVYADNCTDLYNQEMLNVAWWRYARNKVDSYITPPTGETVDDEVSWVYSQYSENFLTLTNPLGQPYFPASVQNCPPQPNNVYSTTRPVYPSDVIEAEYPGDDVTGWTGLDGYGGCTDPSLTVPSVSDVFGPFVSDLHSITSKPVSIDEVGAAILSNHHVPCSTPAAKAAWITSYLQFAQSNNVRMSIWFNDDENDGGDQDEAVFCNAALDYECTTKDQEYVGSTSGVPTVYQAYGEYQAGLQSSWWEMPDPSLNSTTTVNGTTSTNPNGRVMDDATFQGNW